MKGRLCLANEEISASKSEGIKGRVAILRPFPKFHPQVKGKYVVDPESTKPRNPEVLDGVELSCCQDA
jgi:hypothetical protein